MDLAFPYFFWTSSADLEADGLEMDRERLLKLLSGSFLCRPAISSFPHDPTVSLLSHDPSAPLLSYEDTSLLGKYPVENLEVPSI